MRRHWIVVDASKQAYACLRCGVEEPLKLPASIKVFALRTRAFTEEHKSCKEPA